MTTTGDPASALEASELAGTGVGSTLGIQSLERAARMLSLFSVEQPELRLGDLMQRTGMSKATCHRYATTLRRTGLLRLSNGRYSLGPLIVSLSAAALAGSGLVKLATRHLARLVERTSQTALLCVWDGTMPVVVLIEDNTGRAFRIGVSTGRRLPLEAAEGMVFRAFLSDPAGDAVLEQVSRERVAFFEDSAQGLAAFAAPVFQGDEIVATLTLVGTTSVLFPASGPPTSSPIARDLLAAADALSAELGFRPTG